MGADRQKRLDALAEGVRTIVRRSDADGVDTAVAVADLIDREIRRGGSVSLRALAAAGAGVSKSTLANYLAVGAQVTALEPEIARALTLSQHIVLTSITSMAVRKQLAGRSAREGWSTRTLRARIREVAREGPRPFVRPGLKQLAGRANSELDLILGDEERVMSSFETSPVDEREMLADEVDRLVERLKPVAARLRGEAPKEESVLDRAERTRKGRAGDR